MNYDFSSKWLAKKSIQSSRFVLIAGIAGLGMGSASAQAGMVDPTQPPSWGSVSVTPRVTKKRRGFELQTTLVSPGRRIAIINGKQYSVGSRVGAATVTEIKSYEVTLEKAGKKIRLRLLPKVTRSPVVTKKDKK